MHTSDLLPGWHGWGETLGNRRGWRVRAEMQAAAEAQHSQEGSPSLGEGAFACVRASNVVQRTCVCVCTCDVATTRRPVPSPKPYLLKLLNLRPKPSASVCRTRASQIHFPLQSSTYPFLLVLSCLRHSSSEPRSQRLRLCAHTDRVTWL
jgi:hypothetical protein